MIAPLTRRLEDVFGSAHGVTPSRRGMPHNDCDGRSAADTETGSDVQPMFGDSNSYKRTRAVSRNRLIRDNGCLGAGVRPPSSFGYACRHGAAPFDNDTGSEKQLETGQQRRRS